MEGEPGKSRFEGRQTVKQRGEKRGQGERNSGGTQMPLRQQGDHAVMIRGAGFVVNGFVENARCREHLQAEKQDKTKQRCHRSDRQRRTFHRPLHGCR